MTTPSTPRRFKPPKSRRKTKVLRPVAKRLLTPSHFAEFIRRLFRTKRKDTVFNNSQLSLYANILQSDFLHYGYFEDATIRPEQTSLEDLRRAQTRYSEKVVSLIVNREAPVLDVGAGMGGISRLLSERGFEPVPLTPDKTQIAYIREKYPKLRVIEGRFQEADWTQWRGRFGTVLTAESFQYIELDEALTAIPDILSPGGRWVICDYFRIDDAVERSGHRLEEFRRRVTESGWRIAHEEDITPHVLPGLAFAHMMGERFVEPVYRFVLARLERNHPAVKYLFEDVLQAQEQRIEQGLDVVDPAVFPTQKKYMLFALDRG